MYTDKKKEAKTTESGTIWYTDKKEAKTTESGTIWYRDKKEAKATESGTNAPLAFPFNSTGTGPVPSNCRGVSPARLIVS